MRRRREILALVGASPLLLLSREGWAGSYLNRAALLLEESRLERDMVLPRPRDKELIGMVHSLAAARAQAAHDMEVPKTVREAHPHLLLVLEDSERGYAAALDDHHSRFVDFIFRARKEDATFRALIRTLGYTLPSK